MFTIVVLDFESRSVNKYLLTKSFVCKQIELIKLLSESENVDLIEAIEDILCTKYGHRRSDIEYIINPKINF